MEEQEAGLKLRIEEASLKFSNAKAEMEKVIVGQKQMIHSLFLALLSNGHVLLEGLPGLAKTLAATTLASLIKADYKRIQFTPDLLPADLIGTSIYNPKEGTFSVKKGPVFTNILLGDEINRAPAKVQAALLEVMQERQVTISGTTFTAGPLYLVVATQNPIEHEGTYPLPEAQIDRFMLKIKIDYPSLDEEREIVRKMSTIGSLPKAESVLSIEEILAAREIVNQVYIDEKIIDYILSLVSATRNPKNFGIDLDDLLLYGASPRASLALTVLAKANAFLNKRTYVSPHDVKQVAKDALRHRIKRSYEAEAQGISSDDILDRIFDKILVP